jgi:hypothetical protein
VITRGLEAMYRSKIILEKEKEACGFQIDGEEA